MMQLWKTFYFCGEVKIYEIRSPSSNTFPVKFPFDISPDSRRWNVPLGLMLKYLRALTTRSLLTATQNKQNRIDDELVSLSLLLSLRLLIFLFFSALRFRNTIWSIYRKTAAVHAVCQSTKGVLFLCLFPYLLRLFLHFAFIPSLFLPRVVLYFS